jgi:predicted metalloprotease with PDZ domain
MMHVGIGLRAEDGADWIVEGLAEYYSLELLRRSGTISPKRHATALEELRTWGRQAETLCSSRASGPVTAQAVSVLDELDRELRQASGTSLDEILGELVTNDRDIGLSDLQSVATRLAGNLPDAIADKNLPGCGS